MDQVKQEPLHHLPPYLDATDEEHEDSHDEDHDSSKRPRLRLARACDRCKRRKIKCDTASPCQPCITAKQECTFDTPTRRVPKEKRVTETNVAKPRKNVKELEARLNTLEQQLRQVPPHVHNAALSQLDVSLTNPSTTSAPAVSTLPPNAIASCSRSQNSHVPKQEENLFSLPPQPRMFNVSRPAMGGRTSTEQSSNSLHGFDRLQKEMEGMNLSPGFIYLDEMGMTKWQGATSGFPLLELLAENERHPPGQGSPSASQSTPSTQTASSPLFSPAAPVCPGEPAYASTSSSGGKQPGGSSLRQNVSAQAGNGTRGEGKCREDLSDSDFFPGRKPRVAEKLNPEASWKVITGVIPPDLLDTLIRSYLSTTHLLWPFLHVPSFLEDYANPERWGEPGFSRFIVSVCCISSRHVDDPRVRANPADPSSAGRSYFELFKRMQDLPSADRPTLYSIQANFLTGIYAMGLGLLSPAFMLFAQSITMAIDGGLHRDVGAYAIFDPIEREVRKRTFFALYCWDKASGACFGRPAMIHLRDCDVSEPMVLDDEFITKDGLLPQPEGRQSRMCAFVAAIRVHVVLEGVLDGSVRPSEFSSSPFLSRAALVISKRHPQSESLKEEEALLDEWVRILEPHWRYGPETIASKDPIRITQAERLHCMENLVRMLIYRHRFSGFVLSPAETEEERLRHVELCKTAMTCALTIVADYLHISQRGFMVYYGVHAVHQLAQAGRTLVAVILNCKSPESRSLIASSIEGFRSCVGLLRRFSGRYVCGLRSADILEEFCRICKIPVDSPQVPEYAKVSPAWIRPVRRRHSPSPAPAPFFPENLAPVFPDTPDSSSNSCSNPNSSSPKHPTTLSNSFVPPNDPPSLPLGDFTFSSDDFRQTQSSFGDLHQEDGLDPIFFPGSEVFDFNSAASPPSPNPTSNIASSSSRRTGPTNVSGFSSFGDAAATPQQIDLPSGGLNGTGQQGGGIFDGFDFGTDLALGDLSVPSSGMDGLMPGGAGNENLSASQILDLLQEGQFDYSELFPDQITNPLLDDDSYARGRQGQGGNGNESSGMMF